MPIEECIKLDDKTLKESIDNLQGTQFLDAFCVLTHIKTCEYENTNLKQALTKIKEICNAELEKGTFDTNDDMMILNGVIKERFSKVLQIINEVNIDE